MMLRYYVILIFITIVGRGWSQIPIYHDVFHGGVTGDAFNPWFSPAPGQFDIYIEPGSTVRKALLFVSSYYNPKDEGILYFDGTPIKVSMNKVINEPYYHQSSNDIREIQTLLLDVSDLVNPTQNTYSISVVQPNTGGRYVEFYLYVAYENPSLNKVCALATANDIQPAPVMDYYFNLNPIDTSKNVGLALHTSSFCDTIKDGSYVLIEGDTIGLVGGNDNHSLASCNGVVGTFYYQNETLFGLGNDTANNIMAGTDAIANIESYLIDDNSINISFYYQSNFRPYSNQVNQLFLTYTTPCDTFTTSVTKDTTICYGETLQLQATGGQSYEWAAVADSASGLAALSCTDCPNPVFSGNSSQVYTVRIWNNDSCSVVKSVRVNVSNPQYIRCYTGETKCGASNGYIQAIDLPSDLTSWHVVSFNGDTLDSFIGNTLPNLEAGDYSVHYIDNFGCKSNDTIVTVEPYNNTVADFSVNPPSGMKPLEVFLENQSQNATDFEWFLNGVSTGTTPITFFDSSGVYEISLTAWELDPSCADTTSFTVIVFDSLVVTLPNVFTPNGDGVNDFFNIETNLPVVYELSILNRWGNVLFENNGKLTKGTHNLWNGKNKSGEPVTDGTYFYMISFLLDEDDVNCEVTDCEVRKNGFVQVFGK